MPPGLVVRRLQQITKRSSKQPVGGSSPSRRATCGNAVSPRSTAQLEEAGTDEHDTALDTRCPSRLPAALTTRHVGVLAAAAFPATGMPLAAGSIARSKIGEHEPPFHAVNVVL